MSRKMKESGVEWIGKIPENWKISKVNRIFFRRKEVNKEDNPTILSLARDGVKIRDISTNEGQLAKNYDKYHRVYKNDLMINPMDLISGANCSLSEIEGVISPAYINLVPKVECYPKFYDYFFKNQYWVKAMFIHGKGVSFDNRWTINNETMMDYKIPVPSVDEQNKIANYLDKKVGKIDQIIEGNKKIIKLVEEYQKNLITKETEKGNTIKIKYCSEIQPSVNTEKINNDDKVTFTPMQYIKNGFYIANETLFDNYSSSFTLYAEDDIVLAKVTPCFENGNVAIMNKLTNKIGFGSSELFVIRCKENIIKEYMMYCLRNMNFIESGKSIMTGTGGLKRISSSFVSNYKICLPNLKKQEEIVKYLNEECAKLNNAIKFRKQIIEKLEEYKKSLIYEIVTGKVEVEG